MTPSRGIWTRLREWLQAAPAPTKLTRERVLELAAAHLRARGGALREPVRAGVLRENGRVLWHVCDFANMRGGNRHLYFSDETGEVVKDWSTPR